MNAWKFRRKPFVIGVGMAVLLAGSPSGAVAAALPADPCALLKPAEIQALAPGATIGDGKPYTGMAPLGVECTYTWGPRSPKWGESSVTVSVMDASKAWPNTSAEVLEEGLRAKVKVGGPNASQIPGVGDAAAFTFEERSSTAMGEAYLKAKGVHLAVAYHAGDSLSNKAKLIALLKDAAARL